MASPQHIRETASNFLVYLQSQDASAHATKDNLNRAFLHFKRIYNVTGCSFSTVFRQLKETGKITYYNGTLRWRTQVVVDQRVAARQQSLRSLNNTNANINTNSNNINNRNINTNAGIHININNNNNNSNNNNFNTNNFNTNNFNNNNFNNFNTNNFNNNNFNNTNTNNNSFNNNNTNSNSFNNNNTNNNNANNGYTTTRRALFESHINTLLRDNEKMEENKGGITISQAQFPLMGKNQVEVVSIFITNNSGGLRTLVRCEPLTRSTYFGLSDRLRVSDGLGRADIQHGETYTVRLTCRTEDFGLLQYSVFFVFEEGFKILRNIQVSVHLPDEDRRILSPSAPYKRPPPVAKATPALIIAGQKLDNTNKGIFRLPLGSYNVPDQLRKDVNNNIDSIVTSLNPPLTCVSYKSHFHTLLWVEELQMDVDIRRYDTESAMTPVAAGLILKVPGLAESRPSVLRGDKIYVSDPTSTAAQKKEYEGVVHHVALDEVVLKFHPDFHNNIFIRKQLYSIRFSFSPVPLRRMHQAVQYLDHPLMLFPAAVSNFRALENTPLNPFNRTLNLQQLRAVKYMTVISGEERRVPYILFGPPGTGKTVTIIEAMLQIYHSYKKQNKSCFILACAPSNNAADLLVERLVGVETRDMLRLNAFSRSRLGVSDKVLQHSLWVDDAFAMPPLDRLLQYRVVVVTCVSAGTIPSIGVPPGHFTHVFVDEAGQAAEPECITALSLIVDAKTTVVLSGDHKQLGPVIRSPLATRPTNGLNTSYLERMMHFNVYSRDVIGYPQFGNYNPYYVTKLVNNYRSHPAILEIPSALFYDSELQAMADIARRTSLCDWEKLPTRGFPIIFHGIEGKDEREGNSPSWFNAAEALTVVDYINKLRDFPPGSRVNLAEIGVISPYCKQVQKLRTLLSGKMMEAVKVGSVEEFQGQERRVIIISAVRSKKHDQIPFDLAFNLGFLKNPKRFNVAITRAQALLIIIGNPNVLVKDPNWCKMLQYCIQHHAYVGCAPPSTFTDDDEVEHALSQFANLRIDRPDELDDGDAIIRHDNPSWPRDH